MNGQVMENIRQHYQKCYQEPTEEHQYQAKQLLIQLLVDLNNAEADPYDPCFSEVEGSRYIPLLTRAYNHISNGDYLKACDAIVNVSHPRLLRQKRYIDALCILLEKVPEAKEHEKMIEHRSALFQKNNFNTTRRRIYSDIQLCQMPLETQTGFLRFCIDAIKADLFGNDISDSINNEPELIELLTEIVPLIAANLPFTTQWIPFEGNTLICRPSDVGKLWKSVHDIAVNGYSRNENDKCQGYYYPEIKLAVIHNGAHHATIAKLYGCPGEFEAQVYSLADAFPFLRTNGEYWFDMRLDADRRADRKIPVVDDRFALLYSLARDIHDLENGVPPETIWTRNPME